MDRRGFLRAMVIMAGAAYLGLVRPVPRMAQLTVTDPQGRVTRTMRPVHIFFGVGEQWHTHNISDPNPVWEKGALPSLCSVRVAGPLSALYIGES